MQNRIKTGVKLDFFVSVWDFNMSMHRVNSIE